MGMERTDHFRGETGDVVWTLGSVRLLTGFGERLRGLLGTTRDTGAVLITRCRSIHTFGMGYPIDVAFVSREGEVLLVERDLPEGRLASCRNASFVLERPSSPSEWMDVGDRVVMGIVRGEAYGHGDRA